jgi:uroporphyrinogen-III synthase
MSRAVVITRPREDARALAKQLAGRGIDALVEPMLEIVPRPLDPPLDLDAVQAILVTSANGVRALATATARRDLAVLAVGPASAEAARIEGFERIECASGDVAALAKLAIERLLPADGPLVHAAGDQVAGDLAGALQARGFSVRREVLYEARATTAFSAVLRDALADGALEAVLFFSPRSASTFVSLLDAAGLIACAGSLDALCLSDAVAQAAGGGAWRRVAVAGHLDQEAVLALLDPGPAQTPPDPDGSRI